MPDTYLVVDKSSYPYLYFQARGLSFREARVRCREQYNGRLAVIKDRAVLKRISRVLPATHAQFYRIGLSRNQVNGKFTWIDGTTFDDNLLRMPQILETNRCLGMSIHLDVDGEMILREAACSRKLAYLCAVDPRSTVWTPRTKSTSVMTEHSNTTTQPNISPDVYGQKVFAIMAASLALSIIAILTLLFAFLIKRKNYVSVKILQISQSKTSEKNKNLTEKNSIEQRLPEAESAKIEYSTVYPCVDEADAGGSDSFVKTCQSAIYESIDDVVPSSSLKITGIDPLSDVSTAYTMASDVPQDQVVYSVVHKMSTSEQRILP